MSVLLARSYTSAASAAYLATEQLSSAQRIR
jgi:hypothetical protein